MMSVVSLTLSIERETLSGDTGMALFNYELLEQPYKTLEGLGISKNLPYDPGPEVI